jgi:AmmeMemoRadiSam system protein A
MEPKSPAAGEGAKDCVREQFRFSLTQEEKDYLKGLARMSISARLAPGGRGDAVPEPPTDRLREKFGAFVCLKRMGQLRGCIGHIVGDQPLYTTIYEMAQAAAFGDPRFRPLAEPELDELDIEISILSPLDKVPDPALVEPGRHGLLIRRGRHQGLLLPQVATEWNWNREQLLRQTCCKAGLPDDAWEQPGTEIYWFEAEVF